MDSHLVPNKKVPVMHDRQVVAVVLQVAHEERHISHCWFNELAK